MTELAGGAKLVWLIGGVGSWEGGADGGEPSICCKARHVAKRVDDALGVGEVGGEAKSAADVVWKREGALRCEESQESADGRSIGKVCFGVVASGESVLRRQSWLRCDATLSGHCDLRPQRRGQNRMRSEQ